MFVYGIIFRMNETNSLPLLFGLLNALLFNFMSSLGINVLNCKVIG